MLDIRKKALALLAERWGGTTQLAKKIEVTPSYVSQMLSGKRPITEKTAERIEEALGLPAGWMSATPSKFVDVELVCRVIEKVGQVAEAEGIKLSPRHFAEVVILVYKNAAATNMINRAYTHRALLSMR